MIPKLQFDFHLNNDDHVRKSLIFENPLEVITTYNLNEVNECFERIKSAINSGYYVAGYVSYEASYALYNINRIIDWDIPLLWFGVFSEPFHSVEDASLRQDFSIGKWEMKETKGTYMNHTQKILQQIANGETEQVNYTVPFHTTFTGNTHSFYRQLKRAQQAKFNAFLQFEEFDVLSVSPEKFFSIEKGVVTVRPMKGTVERGYTFEADQAQLRWLQQSEKDKRENDLIVGLMRAELSEIASNITDSERYRIEKYPTVYQMTTALTGDLHDNIHVVDVLTTLFPCGSIAGVPKQKTIEIIAEKENANRGIYCGTIGYFTPNCEAVFNVAIRTVTINKSKATASYHAGGAITEQSTATEEYAELLAKTEVLKRSEQSFNLLETFLLEDGQLFLKENHRKRLKQSADYFNFAFDERKLTNTLQQLQESYQSGAWRIRLLLDCNGTITTEIFPLVTMENRDVILAEEAIDKNNVFHYHKTTERTMFDHYRKQLNNKYFDVLLWNENREITEFSIGNVVVKIDGKLVTPPVECGLLPGTFREQLIEDGVIEEAVVTLDDLPNVETIWFINSVRKWIEVSLQQ